MNLGTGFFNFLLKKSNFSLLLLFPSFIASSCEDPISIGIEEEKIESRASPTLCDLTNVSLVALIDKEEQRSRPQRQENVLNTYSIVKINVYLCRILRNKISVPLFYHIR